ncbi:MAG: hypothetical protein QOI82_3494 [Actinomycetota bacterium]|jgi:hypothetical protein|nr:hypothetical protein [Actinomycetota bacterium]
MTRTRWTGLAGVLFGIVFFCISIFGPSTPDSGDKNAVTKYTDYWSSDAHQKKAQIGILLVSYAVLLLVAFSAGLRDRLRTVDAGPLPSYCLAAGTLAAALLGTAGAVGFCVGLAGADSSAFKIDGNLALALDDASYSLLAMGLMAAGSMAVVTAIVTLRTKVLPAWTAWLGFLLGLGVAGSLLTAWTAFLALPIWSIIIGIVLLMNSDRAEVVAPAA